MKRFLSMICCLAVLSFLPLPPAKAQGFDTALTRAMSHLTAAKGNPDLLVLTNAPFVRPRGHDHLALLSKAQDATGAMAGRGNLLFFQRTQDHPFCLMLFKKQDREAVIISGQGSDFAVESLNLGPETISDQEFWKTAKTGYKAAPDLFTLAAMANAWAEGAPYDFLKAAELHNHICPGVTSGYLMAHYILKHYPLSKGERYVMVASPVWCKEDALQVVLDCTPGKRRLVVKPLSEEQKARVTVPDPAGMLLVWNPKTKKGKGAVLSFDFKELKALYPEGTPKAATILYTARHLTTPDRFVSAAEEFDLTETLFNQITRAGTNPYEVAGLTR